MIKVPVVSRFKEREIIMETNITLVNNMENSFANTNSYRCVIGLYMEVK